MKSVTMSEQITVKSRFADPDGKVMIVNLKGYIDQANVEQLQKVIDDIVASGCYNVVFDFTDLYYMSSAGWGIFVGEIRRFRESSGDIKIARMSPEVSQVFQMLEFFHIIEEYPTVEEALEAFGVPVRKREPVKSQNKKTVKIEQPKKEKKIEPKVKQKSSNEKMHVADLVNIDELDDELDSLDDDELLERIKEEASEILNEIVSIDETVDPVTKPKATVKKSAVKKNREQDIDDLLFVPHRTIPLKELPISEKIKKIVGEYPLLSIFQIRSMLKHGEFGQVKIGLFRLYRILKDLNLDTKAKRYRFYRSV